ncbi:ImmA/IrrE family metallo-endopeptidase [Sphingobacterium luzhongxinii]|uniref:ImmA/IrrE family metallo-endopeptidase n=1 Tax=Sphingobacterium luzhongxinii TaxID=2654181 RepID=UPI0013DBE528|nr:ImmA/IrrE family metallo-endopeptidase [Sphingobacterium sp. xlx-73]
MLDDVTKKDIEKISINLLKESKSIDIFPTPVDKILAYSNFAIDNKLDLQKIDNSFFDTFKEKLINPSKKALLHALSKIKGLFNREDNIIFIDTSLDKNIGKKNFVQLHEIGHGVLSWQSDIMLALDNDETLSEDFNEQFEAEANYFASITLFQHDRFLHECAKLELGLGAVMALRKKFGSSVHSAFRNYVLQSKNRCALLVLNHPVNENGKINLLTTRDLFYSSSFVAEIGELELPDQFGFKWSFVQDFKFGKNFHENGLISLKTEFGENLDASYHYFNNTYNSFVFIFPKGEKNKAKTKVLLRQL